MSIDFEKFAACWEDGWNSHDLDRIMSHYRDDICFRSRKADALVGTGELNGITALRAYWSKALERQPDLKFTVRDVFGGHNMMVLTYQNQRGTLAAETLYFDRDGMVFRAAACHVDAL
jgi:hypothetical protein